jgi:glycosyltransferase involved in cell wall biosynthesis
MTEPVPVTFVNSSTRIGGAELFLISLLDGLGRGWVDRVIVPGSGELADLLRDRAVPTEVVDSGRRLGLAAGAGRLRRALRERPPRLLVAHGSRAALTTALAGTGGGPVWVWSRVDRTLDGPVARWLARRCAMVIGTSESVIDALGRSPRRARAVYPGIPEYTIDRRDAREQTLARLACRRDTEVVVLSGQLCRPKGQAELIAAAPRILGARPRAHFALLGGEREGFAGDEDELRGLARELGVERRVHFLGQRPPGIGDVAEAVRFVAGCEVLVAPSLRDRYGWQEGFGLAVAEAMKVGTPVVAYRHGSLPEVLGDAGLVVSEGDSAGLAEAVVRLLGDSRLRESIAAEARSRADRLFDPAAALRGTRAAYAEAASTR